MLLVSGLVRGSAVLAHLSGFVILTLHHQEL